MPDLFISYSRRDADFVRRLHGALTAAEREAWVDWQEIPPTADFMAEIRAAIEGAGAFVFVISPDSIRSNVCGRELEHAVALNKRLVPLVYRDVPASAVPPPLAALNWIFLRETDDFAAGVQTLTRALDTDLDWVRAHTRLTQRAMEWERQREESSLLLRGRDLRAAEDALTTAVDDRPPEPTPLQRRYVLVSRRAATRSQGARLAGVSVALVVSLALAAVAFVQWQSAERERAATLARGLAAQADLLATGQFDFLPRATLLAVEAMRRLPSFEADQALRHSADITPARMYRLDHDAGGLSASLGGVRAVAVSPDGATVATAGSDGWVRLFDAAAGTGVVSLRHEGTVNTLAFDPTGRYLATGTGPFVFSGGAGQPPGDSSVRIWEVPGGRLVAQANVSGFVQRVRYAPDGRTVVSLSSPFSLLATGYYQGRLWRAPTLEPISPLPPENEPLFSSVGGASGLTAVAYAPDGRTLAGSVRAIGGSLRVWNAADGREVSRKDIVVPAADVAVAAGGLRFAAGSTSGAALYALSRFDPGPELDSTRGVNAVAFSPDAKYLAAGSDDTSVRIWDATTGRDVVRLRHGAPVRQVVFNADGSRLAAVSGRTVSLWQTPAGREVARVTHDADVTSVAFDPHGRWLVTGSEDGSAVMWSLGESGRETRRLVHQAAVYGLQFSSDGRRLLTVPFDPSGWLWDVETGRRLIQFVTCDPDGDASPRGPRTRAAAFRPDGGEIAVGGSAGAINLYDPAARRIRARLRVGEEVIRLAYSRDGARLAAVSQSLTFRYTVHVWDAAGTKLATIPDQGYVAASIFDPSGTRIPSAASQPGVPGTVTRVWSAESGAELFRLAFEGIPADMSYSADGRWLLTGGSDTGVAGSARVWDAATGEAHARVQVPGQAKRAVFSPDSRLFATLSGNYQQERDVRVWSADDGRQLVALPHERGVTDLAFSPDSAVLATGGEDGSIRLWEVATGREVARMRHDEKVTALAFSPNGRWLATASTDGTAQLWLWRGADMVEAACARLARNLTRDEWSQYIVGEPYRATCAGLP